MNEAAPERIDVGLFDQSPNLALGTGKEGGTSFLIHESKVRQAHVDRAIICNFDKKIAQLYVVVFFLVCREKKDTFNVLTKLCYQ